MTTHTSTLRESGKRSIAKVFGVLFICAALFASALSLGLPHGSSAASNEVTLKPVTGSPHARPAALHAWTCAASQQ